MIQEILGSDNQKTTVKKVQKLADILQYVMDGILAGRPFLRHLYNLLKSVVLYQKCFTMTKPNPTHHLWLTKEIHKDLNLWLTFLTEHVTADNWHVPFLRQFS